MLPLVLHHGFGGMPGLKVGPVVLDYFRGIDVALAASGRDVWVTRVHPFAGVPTRAWQLKTQILSRLRQIQQPDMPVIIVAHSMGGLDARYMIRHLDMAGRVAALLTVTTPHRGSPMADWVVKHFDRRLRFVAGLKNWVDLRAIADLTTDQCARFNDVVPDVPGVQYFSTSAARPWHRVPAFAYPAHRIVSYAEGENDGLVSVQSSMWGRRLGIWPADHWHTLNHKMVLELRKPTGDIIPYYERAVAEVDRACAIISRSSHSDEPA